MRVDLQRKEDIKCEGSNSDTRQRSSSKLLLLIHDLRGSAGCNGLIIRENIFSWARKKK